ncbi:MULTISPECIES: WD40 repeat domain-containing protein [Protofrankia]|uniref:WD40 repeat-containing protein n=1 Tax=Candidatus Protofrankia datiscae TaxID=2716812 RepID=F8B1F6_9ACTN|nr:MULTISPECIES: WD40 repeat domain-containing protein [Protofrankia]AEH09830.1 WD40 repeat-containing protein [Candidatus Protofrankia datiscae]
MDEQRENGPTGQASTTPPVDAALHAWAVTHARTTGRTGDPARVPPLSDDARLTEPAPRRDEPWAPGDVAVAESSTTLTGGHTGPVMSVAWAAERDGRLLLATGGEDATARVWDPFTGTCLHTLTGHANGVWSVAWVTDSDGRLLLATGSEDTTVRVWDPFTGACLHTMTRRPTRSVMSVVWATGGDGRPLLAAGSRDATVQVWDTLAGSCLRNLTGHADGVNSVAWATGRDGQHLLASGGGYDRTVRIWDPLTGTCLHTLTGHTGGVDAVAWATGRDGRLLLASGGGDGTVRVWDPTSGVCLHALTGHTDGVGAVAWAAGGAGRAPLLASGSFDGTVRVWDPVSGVCLRTLTGYAGPVWSVAWAVGGEGRLLLATGGGDAMVRVVEVPRLSVSTTATSSRITSPTVIVSSAPVAVGPVGPSLRTAVAGLVLLGAGGLWSPLSLLADLVVLTGGSIPEPAVGNGAPTATRPAPPTDRDSAGRSSDADSSGRPPDGDSPGLYDPRLRALAAHPGIGRLRALGWPPTPASSPRPAAPRPASITP